MHQLERMKCKLCGMKISWVSADPKRNYPPALYLSLCRTCYDRNINEASQERTLKTKTQNFDLKIIDTTSIEWRREHWEA